VSIESRQKAPKFENAALRASVRHMSGGSSGNRTVEASPFTLPHFIVDKNSSVPLSPVRTATAPAGPFILPHYVVEKDAAE